MKHVLVELAGPTATVAHRPGGSSGVTGCGHRRKDPVVIDWRNLNPKRVRLCQKCWSSFAVGLAGSVPALPPCEVAS